MEGGGDNNIEFLPGDVISCILVWLPISSLLRFKSVCKSWLSLIEAPDFVDRHMHISSDGKDKLSLLTLLGSKHPQQISLLSMIPDLQETPLDLPYIGSHYQITPAEIVGSCRGIVCLRQHRRVCLWNPATKQSTNLPSLPIAMAPLPLVAMSDPTSVGFGFDPKANDYKVVTLNVNAVDNGYVFHIYTLSSDSWRKFEGFVLPGMSIPSRMNTLHRDTYYCWMALIWTHDGDRGNVSSAIYMFDFSNEEFTSIPIPGCLDTCCALFTITENIACVGQSASDYQDDVLARMNYEIWMLSDYQVKESWTKLYSFNVGPGPNSNSNYIDWMTSVSDDGDFLLFQIGNQLRTYDLVAQQVRILPFHPTSDWFEVVVYRESILSIKRGNGAAHRLTSMDRNRRTSITQSMKESTDWGDSDVHEASIIYRILLWLPASSLQLFKSVCKSWHSLIQSSDFVTQHLSLRHHQRMQDNLSLILHSDIKHSYPMFEDSSHHCPYASCTCLLSFDKLELLDFPTYEDFLITTSYNGIICLGNRESQDCCLWNPVTKQFRDLCRGNLSSHEDRCHLGFGFDTKINDYKLVRFARGDDTAVEVCCLSTDSWRTISDEILPTIRWVGLGLDAPYRDGTYCWLVTIRSSNTIPSLDFSNEVQAILTFDFSSEVFRTIPLPDAINSSSLTLVLNVLRDKIICISLGETYGYYDNYHSNDWEDGDWNCEIWMMNEYNITESWVKLYTVGPFSKNWHFKMCFSKKSGDYMLLLKDGQLYEYNLLTQDRERLPCQIQGPKDYRVVAYEASLVPIK